MAEFKPLQESFAAGEISPLLHGRVSIEGYQSGCKTLRNFRADPRGPAIGRVGTDFVDTVTADDCRILPLPLDNGSFRYAVFHAGGIEFYDEDGTAYTPISGSVPHTADQIKEMHFVQLPGKGEVHVLHKNVRPYKLTWSTSGGASISWDPIATTNFPSVWTGTNWPRTGCYLWGRLWYGGTPAEPLQFWGSRSATYDDFDPVGASVATDPVTYVIQAEGEIMWMMGTKTLLIGTTESEHVIDAPQRFTGIYSTPGEIIDVLQQSAYGSNYVQPIAVGDEILYVSPDGRKVRALQYEWSADNWLSRDLTFFSEHITEGKVKSLAWVQNPNNVLMCLLESGEIAVLSYEREQNVWGWAGWDSAHNITAIAAGVKEGTHVPIWAAERDTGVQYIERETTHRSGRVDSAVLYSGPNTTTITGLDHLNGMEVQVLVNDIDNPTRFTDPLAVHPVRTVVGGQIELQEIASEALVGLAYVPKLTTLPPHNVSQEGSDITNLKSFSDIYVAVKDTFGITINDERPPDRSPSTPMDTRELDKTELLEVSDFEWSQDAPITIKQELPLPVTVMYIATEITSESV